MATQTAFYPLNNQGVLDYVKLFSDSQTTPVVADSDIITNILKFARQEDIDLNPPDPFNVWAANTAYALGAVVVPEPRDNHYYVCTTAGTSGAAQPTFNNDLTYTLTTTDNTVVWTDTGAAPWAWTWNIPYAVKKVWEVKQAKLVTAYDLKQGDLSWSRDQMFKHIQEMITLWGKRTYTQIQLVGSIRDRTLLRARTNRALDDIYAADSWWQQYDVLAYSGYSIGIMSGFTGTYVGEQWVDDM